MPNDFEQIIRFLNQFEDEVVGHDARRPESEVCVRLERLARGECDPAERESLCQALARRPEWVAYLADSIKSLRAADATRA